MALQGRVMDAQNYKKISPVNFDFCKILKIHKKKMYAFSKFVCFCLILYKENMFTDRATIKS